MPPIGFLKEVCGSFLKLGLISFGGPVAHLGYLRTEFVEKRRWLAEAEYADLVALCQFLPGPASSQVVFAIGLHRAGAAGGVLASICFLLPSAVMMIAFGYGISSLDHFHRTDWIHGLKLAAVPVVAQAVWSMWKKLCTDPARIGIALLAAGSFLVFSSAWGQVAAIGTGGVAGWLIYRNVALPPRSGESPKGFRHLGSASALILFAALLFLPVLLRGESLHLAVFDSFYRSGALVFGGGHVVLPLLRAEVVPTGWVQDTVFLAGYGAAQAVPGPLFSFAGYLGAIIYRGDFAWLGGVWCLFAVFLPAWLLIGGVLPYWNRLRSMRWAQASLQGANAAVVGVLLAAFYMPVCSEGLAGWPDAIVALISLGLLQFWNFPSWLIVVLCVGAAKFGRL